MADEVWRQFVAMVQRQRLIEAGETLVAGVSGGPDSLTLLHLLCRLRQEQGVPARLVAAHLNHSLRPEAGDDAAFVAAVASQWGVEHVEQTVDVPALSAQTGLSIEEAARVARYRFLLQAALDCGAAAVAVAHHADDQVESVVMHWLRGAGLAGLRGMLPASRLSDMRLGMDRGEETAGREVRLIRPLLGISRPQIEAYCAEQGLRPRFDRSNLDITIFRNRLRHELIPYLERFNPNFRAVVGRSAAVLARDHDYLHGQVLRTWEALASEPAAGVTQFDLAAWRALHPALQAGLLREAVRRLRRSLRNINEVHIDDAVALAGSGHAGQRATLPQGLMLTLGYRSLWVAEEAWEPAEGLYPALDSAQAVVGIAVPGITAAGAGWQVEAQVAEQEALGDAWQRNADPWCAYLDAGRLDTSQLHLRARRPGDAFQPLGMGGHRKDARAFLVGARVPASARVRYPLVVAGDAIVWLPGLRMDERFRIMPATRRVLILTWSYREGE